MTLTATASGTVSGQPPSGNFLRHKPAAYVKFAESPLTGPTAGTNATGAWKDTNDFGISGVGFGSDSLGPVSPSGCRTDRFYQGMTSGIGSGATLSGWSNPGVYYREFYAYWNFKLKQSVYYAGGVYPLTKIGFICYGQDVLGGGNSGIISFRHDGGQITMTTCQVGFSQQNNVANHRWNQNERIGCSASPNGMGSVTSAGLGSVFTMGKWNELEHRCVLNSAPGVADGIYQQWINGIMTHDYTNVVWITAGATNHFGRFRPCCLVWGGTASATKPNNEDFEVDHAYLAGIVG